MKLINIEKIITKYLDMEAYGQNIIVKQYCNFPKYLPLPAHLEHGWTPKSGALISDLEVAKHKNLMLVFSQRRKDAWVKKSRIRVEIIGSPFIFYKKMMGIKQTSRATGTVVFPSHSTILMESKYDIGDYCKQLKKLPKKFHPIEICLFCVDIQKGKDAIYKKYGFRVISAGSRVRGSLNFARNFYNILSRHKYATSNEIGSYTFYAVEMGIPFFLYGKKTYIVNTNNKDQNIKRIARGRNYKFYNVAANLFSNYHIARISKKQKYFMIAEMGINKKLPIDKLKKILWSNSKNIRYWFVQVPLYFFLSIVKIIIPQKIAYKIYMRIN